MRKIKKGMALKGTISFFAQKYKKPCGILLSQGNAFGILP
jgi:hypothetical protein